MGTPFHLPDIRSRLRLNEGSLQFQALRMITETLAHPQRTLLGVFVQQAADPEVAARFLLEEISGLSKPTLHEVLASWIGLLEKVQPACCDDIDVSMQELVRQRDGNRSCIPPVSELDKNKSDSVIARILPPLDFKDEPSSTNSRMRRMLVVYLGEAKAQSILSAGEDQISMTDKERSGQYMLLTRRLFDQFSNGRFALHPGFEAATQSSARYIPSAKYFIPDAPMDIVRTVELQNRASDLATLPNSHLLAVHERFADALAWLEVSRYMKRHLPIPCKRAVDTTKTWKSWILETGTSLLHAMWLKVPTGFRAFVYTRLAQISVRYFGHTGSDRTFRLPFNLFLRQSQPEWAPRHEAELRTLSMVKKHTRIPVPRGLDTVAGRDSSFLLMTGVPGRVIGHMIHTMTDNQIKEVAEDLKRYVAEMRGIPKQVGSEVQICDALGNGILDWRIGQSQREKLTFRNEQEFHDHLTYNLALDSEARDKISKAYSIQHKIVFTHADLNMRNILVNDKGQISGIVDWECAGWYPEYWEYTKMHFGCRYNKRWIVDVIDQVFDCYYDEVNVEDMLASVAPPW